MRNFLKVVFPILTFTAILVIFHLTAQDSAQSAHLSHNAAKAVEEGVLKPNWGSPLAPLLNWINGLGLRRLAHVAEFFPLGLFAATSIRLWQTKANLRRIAAEAVTFCFANSLLDQVHKMLVPGREFDFIDFHFDAVGYCFGVAICLFIFSLMSRFTQRHRD